MARRPVSRFPERGGNRFRLLIDGPRFYPAMLEAIRRARLHVQMEMYLVVPGRVSDEFAAALIDAAGRGATVQVLLDAFGSLVFLARERDRLERRGVRVAVYNPLRFRKWKRNLMRTHRKILVVDGEAAYVGGAGLGDMFTGERAWRETMIEARGPVVADWQTLFAENWRAWSSAPLPTPAEPAVRPEDQRGRVVGTRGGTRNLEIKRRLLNHSRRAARRLWLATAYFVPSRKVRRALRRAAWRGVDTRLLLPGPITDHPGVRFASRRYYARLLRHGVRIFEYQGRFTHSKVVVADDWCSIGSCNMDRWNLRWNLEANQEIADAGFVDEVARMLGDDFAASREIRWPQWQRRSWLHRTREWLWGNIDLLLARWAPPRRGNGRRGGLRPRGRGMPLVFSYGSLQQADVQRSTYGRLLDGEPDELAGYELTFVAVPAWHPAASSGTTQYANAAHTGRDTDAVSGTVFELTQAELDATDEYERKAEYVRVEVVLRSGKRAWVYVDARGAGRTD